MKSLSPITTKSWKNLKKHYLKIKDVHLRDLFQNDLNRFKKFSLHFEDIILFDYSKNRLTSKTMFHLLNLAKEFNLKESIVSMFQGKKINFTENKSVLHIALRSFDKKNIILNKKNIFLEIKNVLKKIKLFSNAVINKKWKGYTGNSITDVVNIGIGGSDLGPLMVTEALKPYKNHLNVHYISNLDGTHVTEILKKIDMRTTIFLISSKTFTTQETITNATTIKKLFLNQKKVLKSDMSKHFFAISMNQDEVLKFGISKENFFPIWDWVGGRYSVWSAVGLSIALSIGYKNFSLFLKGASSMDKHFLNTPLKKNIPVLLGLISIWYNNFFNSQTEAIFVYDQYMHKFSTYLQQVHMESNGKNIDRNKNIVSWQTGSILWGEPGSNGQHSFYQLLHQGTKLIPSDFIIPINTHNKINDHHIKLLSHFFAQTRSLAFGKSIKEVLKEHNFKKKLLQDKKKINDNINIYKLCNGNQPTNSFLLKKITPYTLGILIALYEHKVFTQGVIMNIFSFDQWGVELGKSVANNILNELKNKNLTKKYDSSTNSLINFYKLNKE
ncbi:glucose-6-phosphate isomerase [Buchnera aphidicola]|uniref:glucose-6-phosphate isomerase n=1 Tax=Buchnera aphidicola TaxID=9 RepID=UPI002237D502|nr:glucose-6-phosphate isomerase [Buchnera aphidicola]MCW5197445.1 glucose-6-phosphate isomerase [Buchnera aphidicola (Chaitophorus viminalis)]